MSTVTGDDTLYQQAQEAATVQSKTVKEFVGVSIDCQAAWHLLQSLIAYPHHQYAESTLALTAAPFDESVVKLIDYRQMADTTLLHLARVHDMKLVMFDQAVAAICPGNKNLALLTL
jgi:hypothetical protein